MSRESGGGVEVSLYFMVPRAERGFKGMVRLRFLIIYPPWFGTEVIITVLLLLLFPDMGFCARSSSVHGMVSPRGKMLVIHCVIDI